MTLPTQLSILRIGLTFLILFWLFTPGWPAKAAALAGFCTASFTDWLDGYLARRLKQASALGAIIDPIADKILTLSLFFAFVQLGRLPLWMAVVIAIREVTVTAIRLLAARRKVVLAAAAEGKQKMVSQVVCLGLLLSVELVALLPFEQAWFAGFSRLLLSASFICIWITIVLTLVSGVLFFLRHRAVISRLLFKP